MKRLAAALVLCAAISAPAFASTPVEREMNEFGEVSQTKSTYLPRHGAHETAPAGYNKAIEEHKQTATGKTGHKKHGKKPHAKKKAPAAAAPAQK